MVRAFDAAAAVAELQAMLQYPRYVRCVHVACVAVAVLSSLLIACNYDGAAWPFAFPGARCYVWC